MPFFAQQTSIDEIEQGRVGRVTEVQRSLITVFDGSEERSIHLTSSWHNAAPEDRPTVGDWIVLDSESLRLERVLERSSIFRRIAAGDKTEIQLIAANIDILFVVTSCNEEFKESRLERYLSLAVEAGVIPVVVLTKIDLADDTDFYVKRARSVQPGVPVELVNALDRSTFSGVEAWIERGSTIALVGSSGVGKSTLLNTLAGTTVAATKGVRDDDKKGRHTTTTATLIPLSLGGYVVDTPGIRQFQLWDVIPEEVAGYFRDIRPYVSHCRFPDCTHTHEVDCAVKDAVADGRLDVRRYESFCYLFAGDE